MAKARRYPQELRERAVRMVAEIGERGAIGRVADQLGIHRETLRSWVRQADIDGGLAPGTTTEQLEELRRLRKENSELRRANEILKSASAFFARELDPRPPR
jgi:transposase